MWSRSRKVRRLCKAKGDIIHPPARTPPKVYCVRRRAEFDLEILSHARPLTSMSRWDAAAIWVMEMLRWMGPFPRRANDTTPGAAWRLAAALGHVAQQPDTSIRDQAYGPVSQHLQERQSHG